MKQRVFVVVVAWCLVPIVAAAGEMGDPKAAVDEVLSSLHRSAAQADGTLYFSLFADDAVFLGTDPSERWSVDELKAFAAPYFAQGRGWTYRMEDRNIFVSADGRTAWFDEALWHDVYGKCRGTGVLVLTDGAWKIVQYNLTFPIPNDLAEEFTEKIREYERREPATE